MHHRHITYQPASNEIRATSHELQLNRLAQICTLGRNSPAHLAHILGVLHQLPVLVRAAKLHTDIIQIT